MCLPIICPLRILNRYLRDQNKIHNAFPIIDCDAASIQNMDKHKYKNYNKTDGKFVGIMLRWHIMIILSKRNFAPIDKLSSLQLLTGNDLTDSEYKNKYIENYQKDLYISLHELNTCYVDFGPYLHLSPFTVQSYTPIYRVYTLFRGLGLRHLIVLNSNNEKYIDGIITANNLNEAKLEHAVNKLYGKIKNSQMSNQDYICRRLQQMNRSEVSKKYKLSKRFSLSDKSIPIISERDEINSKSVSALIMHSNEDNIANNNIPDLHQDDTKEEDELQRVEHLNDYQLQCDDKSLQATDMNNDTKN